MWMIVNRLPDLDLEVHIQNDAPMILKSARYAYATNCVHVYAEGSDVVCSHENDYIKIKDIKLNQAFEIIQGIFDFYDDWYTTMNAAAIEGDFQKIVDDSWIIFHNPIMILDANNQAVGLSKQYGEDDVDEEWKHLKNYGYSSIDSINYFRKDYFAQEFVSPRPQFYHFDNKTMIHMVLSLPIYSHNVICGRINLLQHEREINQGDVQLVTFLGKLLSSFIYSRSNGQEDLQPNVLLELLKNKSVEKSAVERELSYLKWEEDDEYLVYVIKPTLEEDREDLNLIVKMVVSQLPNVYDCIYNMGNHIAVILNVQHFNDKVIKHFDNSRTFVVSKSLAIKGIYNIGHCYEQAIAAVRMASLMKVPEKILDFYNVAINYLLKNSDEDSIYYACHPDVIHLWEEDKANQSDSILTLNSYLDNERSLVNTAQELFIHRNTLVYRLKKITNKIKSNLDDAYTRDYIKLSIRVLHLLAMS
jgi:hypothetical protein